MEEAIERVKPFMYRNARPIDLARWQFHFENGSEENVVRCLAYYQNEDGGFGHALEADAWNPNSSPIQTWAATEILREIQLTDSCHPIIKGILRYLESEKDFTGRVWLNTIKSNNDYPHAPWWTAGENYLEDNNDNPTACLAGFILRFADKESPLYALGHRISGEVIDSYLQQDEPPEMHLLSCYIRLVQYIEEADLADDFDITALKSKLKEDVTKTITSDTAEWASGYICKPSQFFNHKSSMFYKDNQKTADFEYQYIIETQQEDGTWQIPWGWPEYANKWAISEKLVEGKCGDYEFILLKRDEITSSGTNFSVFKLSLFHLVPTPKVRVNYELAYRISKLDNGKMVIIIMAGTRENFYQELKRYM